MKASQLGTLRPSALPATNPATSSISATDSPASTDTIDASSTTPARTAATAMSLIHAPPRIDPQRPLAQDEQLTGGLTPSGKVSGLRGRRAAGSTAARGGSR